MDKVAIIGAGPAGLSAARWLQREGFELDLFEQGSTIGGQWSGDPGHSGIWPSMHTNTCREMTMFSDLVHEPGTSLYPHHREMLRYLERYARCFGLLARTQLRTRVTGLSRLGSGLWCLSSVDADGTRREGIYRYVVIATGRFNKPSLPAVPGLDTFDGPGGVAHTFGYKNPTRYAGQRVLVGGCSVSALEIACDLAMLGARRVVSTVRRPRYIVQKIVAGVPIEHLIQTREAAQARQRSAQHAAQALKELILATTGHPESFGALAPDADLGKAGVAQCQHYLPLVAEGRICAKPWMSRVDGQRVSFADGTTETFDAILFGTGFQLNLPFLSEELRGHLQPGGANLHLYRCTFHPELPGLAILGQFQVSGPYLPPIELQARWVAYAWSGARPLPARDVMHSWMAANVGPVEDKHHMPTLTLQFAREAGVEPEIAQWPELEDALMFGPVAPASFRLSGRDALLDAPAQLGRSARIGAPLRQWLKGARAIERAADPAATP